MSGIYNQPSIYKQGGGGGYADGGELVDGDFIKVENNTVSSYENVSRDPLNFYIEYKDGEVLNAVIELTNEYNATVNVYILQNGLYIPLGNIGGDTVNAGDDYKINIVGNSFMLEVVTTTQAYPEYVELDGEIYPLIKVNNLLWTTKNLRGYGGTYNGSTDSYYYSYEQIKNYSNNGFRLPFKDEILDFRTYFSPDSGYKSKSVSDWQSGGNGTNENKFNVFPKGSLYLPDSLAGVGYNAKFWGNLNIGDISPVYFYFTYDSNDIALGGDFGDTWAFTVRLVKEI